MSEGGGGASALPLLNPNPLCISQPAPLHPPARLRAFYVSASPGLSTVTSMLWAGLVLLLIISPEETEKVSAESEAYQNSTARAS